MTNAALPAREAPEEWVPVDQRWLGLDRRTIAPALVLLVWAVLMGAVVPAVAESIPAKTIVVAPGDLIVLDGGIGFTPAPGWALVDGVLASGVPNAGPPSSVALTQGAVSIQVKTAKFTGTPAELLAKLRSNSVPTNRDSLQEVVTDSGERGVATRLQAGTSDAILSTFVINGVGVEVVVGGPANQAHGPTSDVAGMIKSLGRK